MIKRYFLLLFFIAFTLGLQAQDGRPQPKPNESIEGLNFYPNPVTNGKIYITTKNALTKEVTIIDILGKVVLQTSISTKELNVSSLSPGVYVIKIKEGEATATRKLIIK